MSLELENSTGATDAFKAILHGIDRVPTLPVVLNKILDVLEDPKSNVERLSRLISMDQALSVQILKIVNSAYYGFPRQISTVNQAIVILGFNAVKSLAFSATIVQVFGTKGQDGFDLHDFWVHSISTGVFADMVARRVNYPLPEECLCAAVLHGVGKLILDQYLHSLFIQAVEKAKKDRIPLQDAEREIFGLDHCQVGAMLADKWKLPLQLVDSIRFYPCPEKSKINPTLVALVHVGNYLAREMVCGNPGDNTPPRLGADAKKILKLNSKHISDFLKQAKNEISKAEDILSSLMD